MTFNDLCGQLYFIKHLRLHNVSIHVNFHQNQFINECAREILANIPESHRFLLDEEELASLINNLEKITNTNKNITSTLYSLKKNRKIREILYGPHIYIYSTFIQIIYVCYKIVAGWETAFLETSYLLRQSTTK